MCEFEEYLFNCGCSKTRLKSYCHFARNDPNHQCFGIKRLRNVWDQQTDCTECISKQGRAAAPYAAGYTQDPYAALALYQWQQQQLQLQQQHQHQHQHQRQQQQYQPFQGHGHDHHHQQQ